MCSAGEGRIKHLVFMPFPGSVYARGSMCDRRCFSWQVQNYWVMKEGDGMGLHEWLRGNRGLSFRGW